MISAPGSCCAALLKVCSLDELIATGAASLLSELVSLKPPTFPNGLKGGDSARSMVRLCDNPVDCSRCILLSAGFIFYCLLVVVAVFAVDPIGRKSHCSVRGGTQQSFRWSTKKYILYNFRYRAGLVFSTYSTVDTIHCKNTGQSV